VRDEVRQALAIDESSISEQRTVDITTIGARSGQARRIETWFYRASGQVYLTGMPGKRDWYRNLLAHPGFVFHLKHEVVADLAATATPVTDPEQRRRVLTELVADLNARRDPAQATREYDLGAWEAGSPLMRIDFTDEDGE
jgi:deazaflavin-dependent oxidoreductase (nitroreductase family)